MDVDAYLDRIGYGGPREPSAETLRDIHRAHLVSVPFENLDIALSQSIVLDEDALFDKIVRRRRGGFCYECNGLFAALLRELGFDVGFGDSFIEPMRLDDPGEQVQSSGAYRLTCEADDWTLHERLEGGEWAPQAVFSLRPHTLAEFAGMCHFHQTSPWSSFTRKRICSMATPGGRVTLSDMRLIITDNGQRTEQELASEDEVRAVLNQRFGIDVSLD